MVLTQSLGGIHQGSLLLGLDSNFCPTNLTRLSKLCLAFQQSLLEFIGLFMGTWNAGLNSLNFILDLGPIILYWLISSPLLSSILYLYFERFSRYSSQNSLSGITESNITNLPHYLICSIYFMFGFLIVSVLQFFVLWFPGICLMLYMKVRKF